MKKRKTAKPKGGAADRPTIWFRVADLQMLLGAIDSLGVALVDHDHEWTVGEKEIYEQAAAMLNGAISSGGWTRETRACDLRTPLQVRRLWMRLPGFW